MKWWRLSFAAVALVVAAPPAPAAVARVEHVLAGIQVGRKGNLVLRRYGSPSRVFTMTLGDQLIADLIRNQAGKIISVSIGILGQNSTGPGPGLPGGGLPSYYPGSPPMSNYAPPSNGLNNSGGTDQAAGNSAQEKLVVWTYNYPKKILSRAFVLDPDGKVIMVVEAGTHGFSRTARGVALGDPYDKVLELYGYPDEHKFLTNVGQLGENEILADYSESHGIEFLFMGDEFGRPQAGAKGKGPWLVEIRVTLAG